MRTVMVTICYFFLESHEVQSRSLWRNNHPEVTSDSAGRRAQRWLLNFWDQRVDLSSASFINLTAAPIHRGDLHCRYCFFDWKMCEYALHHEHNVTERKGVNLCFLHVNVTKENAPLAGVNIVGNTWDTDDKGRVISRHLNAEFLHIISLKSVLQSNSCILSHRRHNEKDNSVSASISATSVETGKEHLQTLVLKHNRRCVKYKFFNS